VVSDAEEALVQEQLEQLHDHHSEAHEDDIVSIALPAADGEEDIFGLAGTAVDGTRGPSATASTGSRCSRSRRS
jgi:glutaminase